jgi:hypothetical protein
MLIWHLQKCHRGWYNVQAADVKKMAKQEQPKISSFVSYFPFFQIFHWLAGANISAHLIL